MKELGKYLEQTRTRHGVSVDEAAEDLGISSSQVENIEKGNVRAFQDVYTLKEYVKNYAKYLGLDPDKVLDEFNDFLFERTSKISLTDIMEAEAKRKEKEEPKKKVTSPYTKTFKQKHINLAPIVLVSLAMILLVMILYLMVRNIQNTRTIDSELQGSNFLEEERYEYTY